MTESGTEDASTGDVIFDFNSGDYDYTVENFGSGDVLDFEDYALVEGDAVFNVLSDADLSDGQKQLNVVDSGENDEVTVTLTGLTADQESSVFNQSSFSNTFGDGSLVI